MKKRTGVIGSTNFTFEDCNSCSKSKNYNDTCCVVYDLIDINDDDELICTQYDDILNQSKVN